MKEIILQEPRECGKSVSEQLHDNGVMLSDSNFKEAYASVFQLFARYASCYYEVVEQCDCITDEDSKCGLCGKRELSTYYTVRRVCDKPFVTRHVGKFDFDFALVWPTEIPLGSSCVKLLGIPMYFPDMINSMVTGHPRFKLTNSGYIRIGTLIKHYNKWRYPLLAVPHSVFTTLPRDVMQKYGIRMYLINNPVYPGDCKQASILRSIKARSRNAKYGILRVVDTTDVLDSCIENDRLITLINRFQAERIYNDYLK